MEPDYIRPGGIPPQLTKADLKTLTPEQIVAAQDLGQFEVVTSGRDPLPFEKAGERLASPAEDAQARIDQAEAARVAQAQHRDATRRAMTITEGL